jgi:hypothetical protein
MTDAKERGNQKFKASDVQGSISEFSVGIDIFNKHEKFISDETILTRATQLYTNRSLMLSKLELH